MNQQAWPTPWVKAGQTPRSWALAPFSSRPHRMNSQQFISRLVSDSLTSTSVTQKAASLRFYTVANEWASMALGGPSKPREWAGLQCFWKQIEPAG